MANRREAPFQSEIATRAYRDELEARAAIWEAWVFELDGCLFMEPPSPSKPVCFSYVVVIGASMRAVAFADRAAALALAAKSRAIGFDVRIEVERASVVSRT